MKRLRLFVLLILSIQESTLVTPAHGTTLTVGAGDVKALIEAIKQANANGGVIDLAANATYTFTDVDKTPLIYNGKELKDQGTGPDALPVIVGNITINGNGATLKRESSTKFRFFETFIGSTLVLNDLTLIGGELYVGDGGAIQVIGGSVTLNNCIFTNNRAADGGAIQNDGLLTLNKTRVENNYANQGGGIDNSTSLLNGTSLTINDSAITGNVAGQDRGGGGIFNEAGPITITNTLLQNNAAQEGGALFNDDSGAITITHSRIVGNRSTADGANSVAPIGGAGINNYQGYVTLVESTIADNISSGAGGALLNRYGTFDISGSVISHNSAVLGGAGLLALGTTDVAGADPREGHMNITGTCLVGNLDTDPQTQKTLHDGLTNDDDAPQIKATGNWWGDASGPSGKAKGKGDGVWGNVAYTPFLTAAPAPCAAGLPTPVATAMIPPTATPQPACGKANDPNFQVTVPTGMPGTLTCEFDPVAMSLTITATGGDGLPMTAFAEPIKVCVLGTGSLAYMNFYSGNPQAVKVKASSKNGFLCTTIPAPGMVLLQP